MSEQPAIPVRVVDPAEFDWSAASGPAADVRRVTAAADAADGVVNLNEAACLHLKNRGLVDATLYLADDGYALLYAGTFELVVDPAARGRGIGTALATRALEGVTTEVNAWAHGDHPAAARIAARFDLRR
ncbi:MAG: mycothiol acetyltransferase, partial [Nocardioidaceae bacterium]|nr:mycothiol acetyltransferase [Nocardioidaceae bacterium]